MKSNKKKTVRKKKTSNRYADMVKDFHDWKAGKIKFRTTILDDDGTRTIWDESGPESDRRMQRQAQLKEIRADLGLSQSGMAAALHVATKTLQGWEIGKPMPEPVFILAQLIHEMPAVRKRLLAA